MDVETVSGPISDNRRRCDSVAAGQGKNGQTGVSRWRFETPERKEARGLLWWSLGCCRCVPRDSFATVVRETRKQRRERDDFQRVEGLMLTR